MKDKLLFGWKIAEALALILMKHAEILATLIISLPVELFCR